MKYSYQEVIQYIQEEDVKFIRLAFCDVFGKQKNISIMPDELPRAFEFGIAIDASAITGSGYSDAFTLAPGTRQCGSDVLHDHLSKRRDFRL